MTILRLPPRLIRQSLARGGRVETKLRPEVKAWCREMLAPGWIFRIEHEPFASREDLALVGIGRPVVLAHGIIEVVDPGEIVTFKRRWL